MSGMVDWEFAQQVAAKVANREPFADSYQYDSLEPDFAELTAQAEELVAETTGLPRLAGPARARVTDRAGWVSANINSFQRLLRPVLDRAEAESDGPVSTVTQRMAGAEVGALLGWMSTRVLGQYDLLIIEDEKPEDQDIVYYVGPNVLALEKRYAFPPREFRLWLALHECTHRAQFTGVPWLRPYFLSLVGETLDAVDPDPGRLMISLREMANDVRAGEKPLDAGGLAMLLASPEQRQVIDKISGLMSLLEGHGDVTMDRAGAGLIPSQDRFGKVLRQRRQSASGFTRVLQKVIGLEAKLAQYAQGERFIEQVEHLGGPEMLNRCWEGAEWLPNLEEIREPQEWVDRVRLSEAISST